MNRPVRSPNSRSSASIMRVVEVLPLVPATWITGADVLRVAEQVEQRPRIRSSDGVDVVLGRPGEDLLLDGATRAASAAACSLSSVALTRRV